MEKVAAAKHVACRLYEGKDVPHHSCGICLATTFGCAPRAYQSLRKGGITGEGECGAVKAGEMVLGEYLGDPNPTGAVTEALKQAVTAYRQMIRERVDGAYPTCNALTGRFADFTGEERKAYCTALVADVVAMVAELLARHGAEYNLPA